MKPDDRRDFAEMLSAVYVFFGKDKDFTDVAVAIWWASVQQYDLSAIRDAISKHVQNPETGRFLPKPADVIRMLGGTTSDSALMALHKFETAQQRVGSYMTVVFDDPLIHVVVEEMGGWVALGRVTTKDWEFRRNEFLNRYRGYKMRGEVPTYPAKLIGITEGENGDRFRDHPGYRPGAELRMIGDVNLAKDVLRLGSSTGRVAISDGAALALAAQRQLESKS